MSRVPLKAPFPYFGGKSRIAAEVWRRFGDVPNYVEPFFGSGAVLLARPHDYANRIETVNDADGLLANFWRAVKYAPEEVAEYADWPVNECDLHARHLWLVGKREDITARLMGDPEWFDAKAAGWWVWGISCWIGGGWCSGNGPWVSVDGVFCDSRGTGHTAHASVTRQRPHLSGSGQGVHRSRPQLGNAGHGINRQMAQVGDGGLCAAWTEHLRQLMRALSDRFRRVRVCCGDWSRVCGPSPTIHAGHPCAVFLDPPYSNEERASGLYAEDDGSVAAQVRRWAIERGEDPRFRIALCGYEGEHTMPDSWSAYRWKAPGGHGSWANGRGRANASRECVWFSPHCLNAETLLEVKP